MAKKINISFTGKNSGKKLSEIIKDKAMSMKASVATPMIEITNDLQYMPALEDGAKPHVIKPLPSNKNYPYMIFPVKVSNLKGFKIPRTKRKRKKSQDSPNEKKVRKKRTDTTAKTIVWYDKKRKLVWFKTKEIKHPGQQGFHMMAKAVQPVKGLVKKRLANPNLLRSPKDTIRNALLEGGALALRLITIRTPFGNGQARRHWSMRWSNLPIK